MEVMSSARGGVAWWRCVAAHSRAHMLGSSLGHRRQRSTASADLNKLKKGAVLRAFRKRVFGVGKLEFMLESVKGELHRLPSESLNELEHGAVPPKVSGGAACTLRPTSLIAHGAAGFGALCEAGRAAGRAGCEHGA